MDRKIVTREELRIIIRAWECGAYTPNEVHAWAEERYASSHYEPEDEIANEVLAQLDMLAINLTTLEDVETFFAMLALPSSEVERASAILQRHMDEIGISERR